METAKKEAFSASAARLSTRAHDRAKKPAARRWTLIVALAVLVGACIAAFSSRAGYDERLLDIAARQTLSPAALRETGDSALLRAVLVDAARDPELAFKMQLALVKYGAAARQVLEAFGSEPALHEVLRRFGEPAVPVVAYFMRNDIATLRASYALSHIGRALKARASTMLSGSSGESGGARGGGGGTSGIEQAAPAPIDEYGPLLRGRWAIAQIGDSGHQFLAQFALDAQGVAHWNQTDRVLKSVEDFLLGGIRDLETRYDIGAPIRVGDVASAGVDVLTVFAFAKALKVLRASHASGRAAQWASQSERRALLGQRVLQAGGQIGRAALGLGATAGAVYLVLSHPGLLTGLFVEAGSWLGVPPWAAAAAGWWLVALALSFVLLPLLGWIVVLNPVLTRISRAARWLLGSDRRQPGPPAETLQRPATPHAVHDA